MTKEELIWGVKAEIASVFDTHGHVNVFSTKTFSFVVPVKADAGTAQQIAVAQCEAFLATLAGNQRLNHYEIDTAEVNIRTGKPGRPPRGLQFTVTVEVAP